MTYVARLPRPVRSRLAGAALKLSVFALLVTLYAAILLRTGAVEASAGFPAFLSGLAIAALAILVAVAALVVVWRTGRKGGARAFFAIALSALVLSGPAYVAARGFSALGVVDVSTDLADPPRFDRVARDRTSVDLPTPGPTIPAAQAEAQRAAYPEIATLRLTLPPGEVANLALGLVEDRGWRMLGPTAFPRGGGPTGRIEAVARTRVLGFSEDVSIRIRPADNGSLVDMRSASRIPAADFGGNAARIASFMGDLAAAANVAP